LLLLDFIVTQDVLLRPYCLLLVADEPSGVAVAVTPTDLLNPWLGLGQQLLTLGSCAWPCHAQQCCTDVPFNSKTVLILTERVECSEASQALHPALARLLHSPAQCRSSLLSLGLHIFTIHERSNVDHSCSSPFLHRRRR
jgi:hypothetical protein